MDRASSAADQQAESKACAIIIIGEAQSQFGIRVAQSYLVDYYELNGLETEQLHPRNVRLSGSRE
jgi:cytochrome c oxidase subunit IV